MTCIKLRVPTHTFTWAEHFRGPPFQPHSASNMLLLGREGDFGWRAFLGNTTLPLWETAQSLTPGGSEQNSGILFLYQPVTENLILAC